MKTLSGVLSGLVVVIALAGMQERKAEPTATPQAGRATNLNSSKSNREGGPAVTPTVPTSTRAKGSLNSSRSNREAPPTPTLTPAKKPQ